MSEINGLKNAGAAATTGAQAKRKQKKLKLPDQYRLLDLMKECKAELLAKQPTLEETAKMMSLRLGVPVPEYSVRAAREHLGFTWYPKGSRPPGPGRQRMSERLLTVAVFVRDLAAGLGHKEMGEINDLIEDLREVVRNTESKLQAQRGNP